MYLIAPDGSPLRSLRRDLSADRWLIVYLAASLVALTIALAESGANARRYAKDSAGPLRHGLRLLALGCAFGLCYVAIKVAATGAASFGYVRVGQAFDAWLGRSAAVLAGIATAVGCLTPVLAKAWRYGSEALWAHLAHVRLYTLWATAVTAFPDVALFPSFGRLRDFLDMRQPQVRLYRRIVELRDAQLAFSEERNADHDRASPLNAFACAMAPVEERASRGDDSRRRDRVGLELELSWREEVLWWLEVAASLEEQKRNLRRPSSRPWTTREAR
jgi:hypothetical protein